MIAPSRKRKTVVAGIPKSAVEASKNWSAIKDQVKKNDHRPYLRPKVRDRVTPKKRTMEAEEKPVSTGNYQMKQFGFPHYDHEGNMLSGAFHPSRTKVTFSLAMDCEMVGVGPMKESALARVSIVNEFGYCLYDKFVKPKLKITDYRTEFSGIRESDMVNAATFDEVVKKVSEIIKGHILVGHAVHHDLKALLISHPKVKIRDTSVYYRTVFKRTPSLKALAEKLLNIQIQTGEHSSIQDAQATMQLYRMSRVDWEQKVLSYKAGHARKNITYVPPLQVPSENKGESSKLNVLLPKQL